MGRGINLDVTIKVHKDMTLLKRKMTGALAFFHECQKNRSKKPT